MISNVSDSAKLAGVRGVHKEVQQLAQGRALWGRMSPVKKLPWAPPFFLISVVTTHLYAFWFK